MKLISRKVEYCRSTVGEFSILLCDSAQVILYNPVKSTKGPLLYMYKYRDTIIIFTEFLRSHNLKNCHLRWMKQLQLPEAWGSEHQCLRRRLAGKYNSAFVSIYLVILVGQTHNASFLWILQKHLVVPSEAAFSLEFGERSVRLQNLTAKHWVFLGSSILSSLCSVLWRSIIAGIFVFCLSKILQVGHTNGLDRYLLKEHCQICSFCGLNWERWLSMSYWRARQTWSLRQTICAYSSHVSLTFGLACLRRAFELACFEYRTYCWYLLQDTLGLVREIRSQFVQITRLWPTYCLQMGMEMIFWLF